MEVIKNKESFKLQNFENLKNWNFVRVEGKKRTKNTGRNAKGRKNEQFLCKFFSSFFHSKNIFNPYLELIHTILHTLKT